MLHTPGKSTEIFLKLFFVDLPDEKRALLEGTEGETHMTDDFAKGLVRSAAEFVRQSGFDQSTLPVIVFGDPEQHNCFGMYGHTPDEPEMAEKIAATRAFLGDDDLGQIMGAVRAAMRFAAPRFAMGNSSFADRLREAVGASAEKGWTTEEISRIVAQLEQSGVFGNPNGSGWRTFDGSEILKQIAAAKVDAEGPNARCCGDSRCPVEQAIQAEIKRRAAQTELPKTQAALYAKIEQLFANANRLAEERRRKDLRDIDGLIESVVRRSEARQAELIRRTIHREVYDSASNRLVRAAEHVFVAIIIGVVLWFWWKWVLILAAVFGVLNLLWLIGCFVYGVFEPYCDTDDDSRLTAWAKDLGGSFRFWLEDPAWEYVCGFFDAAEYRDAWVGSAGRKGSDHRLAVNGFFYRLGTPVRWIIGKFNRPAAPAAEKEPVKE
jgi:hypothetical protein